VQTKISSIWQSWTLVALSRFVLILVLPAPVLLSCPSKMHPLTSHASWSLHLGLRSSLHLRRLLHVSCACGNSTELAHLHVCAWFPLHLGASCSLGWPRRLGLVLSVCAARGITGISITSRFRYSFKSILRGRIFVQ
jgi:hypothetical protein